MGNSAWQKRICLRFSRCYSTVNLMKLRKSTKTWQKTRKPNLLRHKSGRYYGRAFAGGKEVWKSLKTSHFSVAEARLGEFLQEHRERRSNGNSEVSAKMSFCEALKIHQQNQADDVTIKPTTRHYWKQIFVALLKSWPGLADREIRRITKTDCNDGSAGFARLRPRHGTTTRSQGCGTCSTWRLKRESSTSIQRRNWNECRCVPNDSRCRVAISSSDLSMQWNTPGPGVREIAR